MALDLEFEAGVFLHQFSDAAYLDCGFGLQGSLSGVEGDGIGDYLPVGGQTVIKGNCPLRQTDVADAAVGILGNTVEIEISGGFHGRHIDDAHTVDITLEGPLVEGKGIMVPFACLQRIVLSIISTETRVETQFFFAVSFGIRTGFAKTPFHV